MANDSIANDAKINITVLSPNETLFSGEAAAITCHNDEGDFDVLPLHTNFISLINQSILIHLINGETKKIDIGNALLKALENNITILLNIDLTEKDVLFKALFQQLDKGKQQAPANQPQAPVKK